jgi:single-strand DNA-binding protein
MPNYNKVILVGHLTRDPECKFLQSGTAVCDFGVANNRKWKDAAGQAKEEVCFVDAVAFGKTGEIIAKHFTKGKAILIEGRLKMEQWEDKQGNKRSKIGVVVESFTFIGGGVDGDDRQAAPKRAAPAAPAADDDVPF